MSVFNFVKGFIYTALLFLIGVFGLLMLSVILFDFAEKRYTTYATINEAKRDGAIRRGWIPDWLPSSAVEIHEYHDLDTNSRAISFGVASPHTFEFSKWCVPTESASRPSLRTKLMPRSIHRMPSIKMCYGFYVVIDNLGTVHVWKNYH